MDVRYQNARLRADHVEYDNEAQVVVARGNVQLDYLTQHVEADDARYELRTGRGTFHHVRGTFAVQRRPVPTLLISPNPLYFEAEEADRLDDNTYRIRKAWLTVCKPGRPVWKFYAPAATVRLKQSVRVENGNFRLFSIPVLYLPFATIPAEQRRDSGFLVPESGEHLAERLRARRFGLLGAARLAGCDSRRGRLHQARLEPEGRFPHAALGRRATRGELLRRDRSRTRTGR